MFEQISLFDIIATRPMTAKSCLNGTMLTAQKPEPWMLQLVPKGEYVIPSDKYPLVLVPTKRKADQIPSGHHYYHYVINGQVYAGTFVGREVE